MVDRTGFAGLAQWQAGLLTKYEPVVRLTPEQMEQIQKELNKVTVTKDMTEKDIMKVWVDEFDVGAPNSGGYTDAKWRAECEQRREELRKEHAEHMKKATIRQNQQLESRLKANTRQIGGDHYKNMGVEPWDVVDTWPIEQQIGAHRKDALKYLMRMYDKNTPLENAAKALHCLEKLVEVMEQYWEEKHGNA